VDYAYASTVHKSQGSTFDTVFVDRRDLQACRGDERDALLYVAVTRPSRRLALLV
jgi:exodeoxyribonuclease-5